MPYCDLYISPLNIILNTCSWMETCRHISIIRREDEFKIQEGGLGFQSLEVNFVLEKNVINVIIIFIHYYS